MDRTRRSMDLRVNSCAHTPKTLLRRMPIFDTVRLHEAEMTSSTLRYSVDLCLMAYVSLLPYVKCCYDKRLVITDHHLQFQKEWIVST